MEGERKDGLTVFSQESKIFKFLAHKSVSQSVLHIIMGHFGLKVDRYWNSFLVDIKIEFGWIIQDGPNVEFRKLNSHNSRTKNLGK